MTITYVQFPSLADKGQFFIVPNGFGEALNPSQGGSLNVKGFNGLWGAAAPPKNLYGQISWKNHSDGAGYQMDPRWGVVISSKAKHIAQLVKLIDYQYSPQIFNLYNYGIKGVTYTIGSNGQPQFKKSILNTANHKPPINTSILTKYPVDPGSGIRIGIQWIPQSRNAEDQLYGQMPVYLNGKYTWDTMWHFTSVAGKGVASANPNNFAPSLALTSQQQTAVANYTTTMNTYMQENLSKFILGQKSFSQWPAFVKKLQALGHVKQVLAWDNAALAILKKQNHWSYKKSLGING